MRSVRLAAATVAGAIALSSVVASEAGAASKTLRTGFMDNAVLGLGVEERQSWLRRATGVGASVMRVNINWDTVAPVTPPAGAAPDPAWSGYAFATVDSQIRAAQDAGMTVLLNVSQGPAWAQEPGRPKSFKSYGGNWKPDPAAFGEFMTAVAKRYSGETPDPSNPGEALPKVMDFQIWNEPNLDLYLGPQYEDGKPFAPKRWRELVNAGYRSVKAIDSRANVVAAGLAPFGDPVSKNAPRTRPVAFLRDALCLDDRLEKTCDDKMLADTFSLHPYAVDRPSRGAYHPDDATVPDYNRIATVLTAARRAKTVGPKTPKRWVTEISYDSRGPDPKGVPQATRARYISESMWRLWRVGVNTVVWYLMRDAAPEPSYAASYQSGIFYRGGRRKSDARAFRFPLLVTGKSKKRMNVWFRTPSKGTVTIQVRKRGRWISVAKKRRLRQDGVARVKIRRPGVSAVRGIAGNATSYVWKVR